MQIKSEFKRADVSAPVESSDEKQGAPRPSVSVSESSLLNERAAAAWLGLGVSTLRRRRFRRQTPPWIQLGARILYRKSDLEAFIQANLVQPAQPDAEAAK